VSAGFEDRAMKIPSLMVRQLYTFGSLENAVDGFRFSIKNRLSDVVVTRMGRCVVDGEEIPLSQLRLELPSGRVLTASAVSPECPLSFAVRDRASVHALAPPLREGPHEIRFELETSAFGALTIQARDAVASPFSPPPGVPYDQDDRVNYSHEMVARRQRFVEEFSGVTLNHLPHYSFDPVLTRGNIENFTGVAQIPIGFAGPLHVNGEHAQGHFLIPLAATEGTLVASYNRGMKVLNLSGGVMCTVADDCMQRAPVFVFDSAREARDFRQWIDAHLEDIRREAEATSHVARLLYIETYLSNKFAYLRFNFATGDAAGQNMVGRATFAACGWILEHARGVRKFYLESNFATDKKASHVNMMRTRGKRVTAEAIVPRQVLREHLRVEPEVLQCHAGVANVGAFLSGTNNNGLHSANAITALFIATGQDVANVAEGSAALVYSEITAGGDFYLSITLPSLIVGTHGGGTGLATQRECLEILGCAGKGKVSKLAEIVAGVVLAGELSLAAAISSLEWVSAHERYGRKR
jgi:hydroxymethylglutaryl-CoA reductase (NADPH)